MHNRVFRHRLLEVLLIKFRQATFMQHCNSQAMAFMFVAISALLIPHNQIQHKLPVFYHPSLLLIQHQTIRLLAVESCKAPGLHLFKLKFQKLLMEFGLQSTLTQIQTVGLNWTSQILK